MLDQEMIRTFIQVADCQSFTKAAEMLHKTSAAISYRIKTLERILVHSCLIVRQEPSH
ncbi:DNA-binding transcriptional activator AllS [Proteus mirabilis]|uniref:DNA-binding transcriptional activator AllS n=1 Tax=Proteus mirabilis TaxID=584 RepID=A0A2X2C7H2_PROMI|nr:DNA-binding transcriptional activator AllS [Proteus mirabilis]